MKRHPSARIKYRDDNSGDITSIEFFILHNGIVIHRHVLTQNEHYVALIKDIRKFGKVYYTTQEIVFSLYDLKTIVNYFFPVRKIAGLFGFIKMKRYVKDWIEYLTTDVPNVQKEETK